MTGATEAAVESVAPESPEALAGALREAVAAGRSVLVRGHGTRADLGALPSRVDAVVSTALLDGVVEYEPAELTITVQAGMPLMTLDALLAEHGQWLPLQPYRGRGTVGGLLASGADGALALSAGGPRDPLIGARVAHADGRLAKSRGRVVKNVAGYDIPRLMVGSLGTLGVIVEASFKLLPHPARQTSVIFGFESTYDAHRAARAVLDAPWEPSHVNVLCGACEPQLALGFDGSATRVPGLLARATEAVAAFEPTGRLALDDGAALALRRRLDDPAAGLESSATGGTSGTGGTGSGDPDGRALLRVALLPARLEDWVDKALGLSRKDGVQVHADLRPGLGLAFLAVSCERASQAQVTSRKLLEAARETGHAVLLAGPDVLRGDPDVVWGPPPPDFALMTRVKQALDPTGVFTAGRHVGGL